MKKYLKGLKKRYFSLTIIAIYSTLHIIGRVDANYIYHKLSHKSPVKNTSPPFLETFY